jgi:hypothetical protein
VFLRLVLSYHLRLGRPGGFCPQIFRLKSGISHLFHTYYMPILSILPINYANNILGLNVCSPLLNSCLWSEFLLQHYVLKHPQSSRCEVVTTVMLKLQVFWDVTPCRVINSYRCFGRSRCRYRQTCFRHR